MSPHSLLARWRDRWGLPSDEQLRVPYVYGPAKRWSDRLVQSWAWLHPAWHGFWLLVGAVLAAVLVAVGLSLDGQVVASATLLGLALFLRRYGGLLATLVLLCLSAIVTSRYFLWRYESTLGGPWNPDYLFAFALCTAELYLALLLALGLARALWPLTRPIAALPADQASWPDVDIFLLCSGHSAEAVSGAARAALALDWPRAKRSVYLLDDVARPEIGALAATLHLAYLPHKEPHDTDAGRINSAMHRSGGSLILVLAGAEQAPPDLLTRLAGAFIDSAALGMLHSPIHALAPPPLALARAPLGEQEIDFALLRRSSLVQAGGIAEQFSSWQPHTGSKLAALGYACCYAGMAAGDRPGADGAMPAMVRVEQPFSPWRLRLRHLLARIEPVLRFYYPPLRVLFWSVAPLALLAGVTWVEAPLELLLAFLAPHLLHGHIALARARARSRLDLVAEARELLLGAFLLLPTAWQVVRTALGRLWRRAPDRPARFAPLWAALHALLVLLHIAALGAGALALASGQAPERIVPYMLWALYHLLVLLAMLAVAEEARHIVWHKGAQAARPAMLRLPLGRSLACTTVNFPDPELVLRLPVYVPLQIASTLPLTLFAGQEEWALQARVREQHERTVHLSIDPALYAHYQEAAERALARGPDWPAWLPGPSADRPVPVWLYAPVLKLLIGILDFITLGHYLQWLRMDYWSKLWTRKHDKAN